MHVSTFHKIMNQMFKCYENNHASSHKLYVCQFGNINSDGHFIYYEMPGVDLKYWHEIPFEEFAKYARSEGLFLIDFIVKNKRLPNYILNQIPIEYRRHL